MDEQERTYITKIKKELQASVLEVKHSLVACQHASLLDRNPYLRTSKAKKNVTQLEQSIHRCLDALLQFSAVLAKYELCERQKMHSYFFTYQFLFDFHDGIKKQELIHQILIKNIELTSHFYTFFDATWKMIGKLNIT